MMNGDRKTISADIVVVGGGPAGLTAASCLAARIPGKVLLLEREREAGGIPRHSDHTGYGLRDLRRVMTGPSYARLLVRKAEEAGTVMHTEAMVTGWAGDRSLDVTTPRGLLRVEAQAVVLATGARERPRPARLVSGDRSHGVYTTGQLQNLVHLHHAQVGSRAVVIGSELVSWSAVLTLRKADCRTVLMTSKYSQPEAYHAFTVPGRTLLRVPVATRTRVTRVIGRGRVEAVEVDHLDSGARRTVACDTVIFTGDWIPDHELSRSAALDMDAGTRGPLVDSRLRTSRPGVFAAGNLLHPVDSADVAALDGRHVAEQVAAWLADPLPAQKPVRLLADPPLRWVAPGLLRPDDPAPPRRRLLLWTDRLVRVPTVVLRQDDRVIAERKVPWPAVPGRVFRVPASVLDAADRSGGTVRVGIR